jgi:hypothetical protein
MTVIRPAWFAAAIVLAAPLACSKASSGDAPKTESTTASDDKAPSKAAEGSTKATEVSPPEDTSNEVIQEAPFGTVGWLLEDDGVVKADVRDKSGNAIADDFAGTLASGDGASKKEVSLAPIDGSTMFGATLPAFASDLTAVSYALKQGADTFDGTFFVPAGGSSILTEKPATPAATAGATTTTTPTTTGGAQAAIAPPTTTGPNGGVIQTIGEQRVELVSDQTTGEVRAYLLDAANKIIPLGDRKITLGVVGDQPELVTLQPAEGADYAVASWGLKADPVSLTIAIRDGKKVHAGVWGWRPGAVVPVKPKEPVHLVVKRNWPAPKGPLVRAKILVVPRAELEAKLKLDEEARAKRRKEHPEERRVVRPIKEGAGAKREIDDKRPRGEEPKKIAAPIEDKRDGDDKRPRKEEPRHEGDEGKKHDKK